MSIDIVRCMRCHRKLIDPVSKSRGIGDTCLKKINSVRSVRRRLDAPAAGQLALFDHSGDEACCG